MIYIKDIGLRKSGKKVVRNNMYALYKCNECENTIDAEKAKRNKIKDKLCRECTIKLHGDKIKKHGDSQNVKLYYVWRNMRNRCDNEKAENYHRYGGRGIKICEDWYDYESFKKWSLRNGYKEVNGKKGDAMSIDRIDVNGNYEPLNCQFIKNKINSYKDSVMLTRKDELAIKTIKEYFNFSNKKISKIFGCGQTLIHKVINNKAKYKGEHNVTKNTTSI